jgi:peptidoglycan/LPS O-acetylase OafA/YrhL
MSLSPDGGNCIVNPSNATLSGSQGETTQPPPTGTNHLFANNVRFLAMAAIIAMHTMEVYPAGPIANQYPIQLFKFGTIGFFLVSGFLFGERIDRYTSAQYFGRRLQNVFVPWCVWFLLYCCLRLAGDVLHGRISFDPSLLYGRIYAASSTGLFETAYWFVPNLMIAMGVLLLLRRKLRDSRIGFAFLLLSLFYAANIYGGWIPVMHSRAAFGFIFYLWLGAWAAWNFAKVERWLSRIPAAVMVGLIVLTNALALGEAKLLFSLHSVDPLNTLRITNQLASVVVVLGILKLKHAVWPRFVEVRAHTFGLYLTHTIALALLLPVLVRILPLIAPWEYWRSLPSAMVLLPVMFVLAYGGSLLVVRCMLAQPRLHWAVGLGGSAGSGSARRKHNVEKISLGKPISSGFTVTAERLAPLAGSK